MKTHTAVWFAYNRIYDFMHMDIRLHASLMACIWPYVTYFLNCELSFSRSTNYSLHQPLFLDLKPNLTFFFKSYVLSFLVKKQLEFIPIW
ncbi:hypothetical protein L1987_85002 [Smallanthus sonchifolius]|uniref:Uncharacterized protein n=1 Tax=Smallanthus sonchifolius TaxID=185202 RepID=A0ACB8XW55_9ASTR|nr:hypothetical protein L1987_85002 [Smallanthus sonchifolius]